MTQIIYYFCPIAKHNMINANAGRSYQRPLAQCLIEGSELESVYHI